ncbi:phosphoadenylyl-sulfate reductase [Candidatus Erwinia haradaeae]|uniref:Phosphoadenosine 5'-phosphosulfate reductase n=1 Tax=Candidatus Erwinia haradaeae TaxID=1922217 RepID=A0A803FUE5_9GAMM|nr:phosphoadenylyl-sulfate reductase [Candidatus Erwinia haradaeae]VFP88781.1 Phosphoadenosine phosphosulfate reductase [Candidatus Erwinia haradaeae]
MTTLNLVELNSFPKGKQIIDLANINANLEQLSAEERVTWALANLPGQAIVSSSFGIQSAVSLHLITTRQPDIPVVITDTGYLFPETYRFIDHLTTKMNLNLKVFRCSQSSAWQEARYGKLWEKGLDGLNRYNNLNKVEPMNKALKKLKVKTWFAGLRRDQSVNRSQLPVLDIQKDIYKFLPIIDWTNQMIYQYIKKHHLPIHPLQEQGYVSIGDVHSTKKLEPGMKEEETRFFGLKRECGLHE